MAGYTEEQKKQLTGLIEKWRAKLRLQHWRIEVNWDQLPQHGGNVVLEVYPQPEIHYASIRVGSFFSDDLNDRERENAVVHELIHCHAQSLWDSMTRLLDELAPQAAHLMAATIEAQFETMIDALATSFAPKEDN